jgi:predicted neutral ceramidase superfamily lipid hydrolase
MNWNKILKIALYAQAIVAIFLTIGMITGKIAPADIEPINGRKVAAFAFAFAITLVLVARQFKNDIRWLLIPIFVTGINLIDTLYEFGIRGDHINFMPPMIIEPIFLLIYIVSYVKLNRKSSTNDNNTYPKVAVQ